MGQDPFTGLTSWEHLILSIAPFLWKLAPLVALETPYLLFTVFLFHALPLSDPHWLLPPSSFPDWIAPGLSSRLSDFSIINLMFLFSPLHHPHADDSQIVS